MKRHQKRRKIGRASAGNARSATRTRDVETEERMAEFGRGLQTVGKACKAWLREHGEACRGMTGDFSYGSRRSRAEARANSDLLESANYYEDPRVVAREMGWVTG